MHMFSKPGRSRRSGYSSLPDTIEKLARSGIKRPGDSSSFLTEHIEPARDQHRGKEQAESLGISHFL